MNSEDFISDEKLNAFLDKELDDSEQARILARLQIDKDTADRFAELRQLKEKMTLAYASVPEPTDIPYEYSAGWRISYAQAAILTIVLISIGAFTGWNAKTEKNIPEETIIAIDQLNLDNTPSKILLHISTSDEHRINTVLSKARQFLSSDNSGAIEMEIVANAEGLSMLRNGSPFTDQIRSIRSQHENIRFLACGIAKQNAALREGKNIELIRSAQEIPAALDRILNRIDSGWTYVKG